MDVKEYLKEFDVLENEVVVDNKEWRYLDARYIYNDRQFIRCIIFDFIKFEEYEKQAKKWSEFDNFLMFEREVLEDLFFASSGDERFNIYMIFVVKNDSQLYKNPDIVKDFRYARKLIFSERESAEFFRDLLSLRRENDNFYFSDVKERKELLTKLCDSNKFADNYLKKEMVTLFYLGGHNKLNKIIERIKPLMAQSMEIAELFESSQEVKVKHNKITKDVEEYQLNRIESISIKKYRCFADKNKIPFGKVNLICGENGVGKTSLLEAIELGITGLNHKDENIEQAEVVVKCLNKENRIVELKSNQDNTALSESWYGIQAENIREFNNLFRKWNYFDTAWASTFAIKGENQVELLKKFLGISDIEKGELLLKNLYVELLKLSKENYKSIDKAIKPLNSLFRKMKKQMTYHELSRMKIETECRIRNYETELAKLNNKIENSNLEEILNSHIKKIEKMFKLLIASNEYKELQIRKKEEMVAIRNITNEAISMSKMSTGEKVCLALAFMFSLFLSSDTAPNVIMLDEPVANLDDYHMLNMLDVLRRLALSDTQIFFTTANPDVAKLFRRKFSFLEDEFKCFTVMDDQEVKIKCEIFSPSSEDPVKTDLI